MDLDGEPRRHSLNWRLNTTLIHLWRVYAYLDLMFFMKDARRFIFFTLADAAQAVAFMSAMLLLAERFDGIGPWNKYQVAFMLGYGQALVGLLNGVFFGYNITHISRRIGRGQLDHSLVQPHSLLTTFLTDGFTPFYGIGSCFPGFALLVWSTWKLGLEPTPLWVALLILQLAASAAIEMSFHFVWGTLAFWAPRGAEEVSSETHHLMDQLRPFPLDGVSGFGQAALLTFLPAGFLAWYPSRALLGLDSSAVALTLTPVAALLALTLAAAFFRVGLRHYARTGSTRYSDFGHRR